MYALESIIKNPSAVVLPRPTRSHPEWCGKTLGEIKFLPDGLEFLEFAATGEGNGAIPYEVRLASALLLAQERGWLQREDDRGRSRKGSAKTRGASTEPTETTETSLPFSDAWKLAQKFASRDRYRYPTATYIRVRGRGRDRWLTAVSAVNGVRIDIRAQGAEHHTAFVVLAPPDLGNALTDVVPDPDNKYYVRGVGDGDFVYRAHQDHKPGDFPLVGIEGLDEPMGSGTRDTREWVALLKSAAKFAAKDAARDTLRNILVGGDIVASDGYRMFVADNPLSGFSARPVLLPAEFVKFVTYAVDALGEFTVLRRGDYLHLVFQQARARVLIPVAHRGYLYPDYQGLIPNEVRVGTISPQFWRVVATGQKMSGRERWQHARLLLRVEGPDLIAQVPPLGGNNNEVAVGPICVGKAAEGVRARIWLDPCLLEGNGEAELWGTNDWREEKAVLSAVSFVFRQGVQMVVMPMTEE